MIIWLASYPRSGNTFLRIILKTYFGISSYSKYNDETDIGRTENFAEQVGHIKYEGEWPDFYKESKLADETRIIKTHDLPEDNEKAIYLMRDGQACVESYQQYLSYYSKMAYDLNDVIAGAVTFGSWSDHVKAWNPVERPNTLLLKFEELTGDTGKAVTKLAKFLGRKPAKGKLPSFAQLHEHFPEFFKTGSNAENIKKIGPGQKSYLNFVSGPTLKKYGYIKETAVDFKALADIQKLQARKLLATKREIAALTDTHISSKLEGRVLEIRQQIAKIIDESQLAFAAIQENRAGQEAAMIERIRMEGSDQAKHQATQIKKANNDLKKWFQDNLRDLEAQITEHFLVAVRKEDVAPLVEKLDQFGILSDSVANMEVALLANLEKQGKEIKTALHENSKAFKMQNQTTTKSISGLVNTLLRANSKQEHETQSGIAALNSKILSQFDSLNRSVSKLGSKLDKSLLRFHNRTLNNLKEIDERIGRNEASLKAVDILVDAKKDHAAYIQRTEKYINELEFQRQELQTLYGIQQERLGEAQLKADRFRESVSRLAGLYDEKSKKLFELEHVLEPRLKSLLEFRPLHYVLKARKQLQSGDDQAPPDEYASSREVISQAERSVRLKRRSTVSPSSPSSPRRASPSPIKLDDLPPDLSASPAGEKQKLGIAVFTFDRKHLVHNVLESLAQQHAIDKVHVWIDGDQGRPDKRKMLDQTESLVRKYDVNKVHRNRGNFGFRKMMIMAQRYMLQRYENIIFLEDDCFPRHNAIAEFMRELDVIRNKPKVFSVYGHHFLVPREKEYFDRFQGWGWATTAQKLHPVWTKLLRMYLKTEEEYLEEIQQVLTPEIITKIDITPGRQPTSTIKNFFAWDEALCLITALEGLTHKRSDKRLIYNCGAGESSSHFTKINYYRKPPFNMIADSEVWDYF